jgi:hypothetical protein
MGDAAVSYQQRFRDAFWRWFFDADAAEVALAYLGITPSLKAELARIGEARHA